MDIQKAIKTHIKECEQRIEVIKIFMETCENSDKNQCKENIEKFEIAKTELEKRIPKKTVKDKYHRYCCPNCDYIVFMHNPALIDEFVHYCENCGQALDWSEEENECSKEM